MKRLLFAFMVIFLLSGCSGELKAANTRLEQENAQLRAELEEIKNGAQYLIGEIRTLFEKNDFDAVIEKASELHGKFNGSDEDIEAQGYVNEIKNQREKEAQARKEEQEWLAAQAAKTKQDKLREIIRVKRVYIYDTDSAGRVDISIDFSNNSDKEIKYLDFEVIPLNAVGDAVKDHGMYDSEKRFRATGPFSKGEGLKGGWHWQGWYNATIETLKLTQLDIEYMDGTKLTIDEEDIPHIIY